MSHMKMLVLDEHHSIQKLRPHGCGAHLSPMAASSLPANGGMYTRCTYHIPQYGTPTIRKLSCSLDSMVLNLQFCCMAVPPQRTEPHHAVAGEAVAVCSRVPLPPQPPRSPIRGP
eukprot:666781-Rhodomonas_salina.4